jgi:hypothetical protein
MPEELKRDIGPLWAPYGLPLLREEYYINENRSFSGALSRPAPGSRRGSSVGLYIYKVFPEKILTIFLKKCYIRTIATV